MLVDIPTTSFFCNNEKLSKRNTLNETYTTIACDRFRRQSYF